LLENVASKGGGEGATSADTRFKAVEAFCQMLTEIRSLGEGLIIADQSPEKLARDAMRNTNLQIAHQLRDSHDREAIGSAMIMEKEQRDFLGKLVPGQAALFRTGLEKATFIQVDKYYPTSEDWAAAKSNGKEASTLLKRRFRGVGFDPNLTDEQLAQRIAAIDPSFVGGALSLPMAACVHCKAKCQHRDAVFHEIQSPDSQMGARDWFTLFENSQDVPAGRLWETGARTAREGLQRAALDPNDADAGWCYFAHLWHGQYGPQPDEGHQLDHECYQLFVNRFQGSAVTNTFAKENVYVREPEKVGR
jgi:hypothetical protein